MTITPERRHILFSCYQRVIARGKGKLALATQTYLIGLKIDPFKKKLKYHLANCTMLC